MQRYLSANGEVTVDDDDVTVVYKTRTRAPPDTTPINLVLYLAMCKLLLTREGSIWQVLVAGGFSESRSLGGQSKKRSTAGLLSPKEIL